MRCLTFACLFLLNTLVYCENAKETCVGPQVLKDIEKKLQDSQTELALLKTKLDETNERANTAETHLKSLENQKSSLEAKISALESEKKELLEANSPETRRKELAEVARKHDVILTKHKDEFEEALSKCKSDGDEEISSLKADLVTQRKQCEAKLSDTSTCFRFNVWSREKLSQSVDLLSDTFDWTTTHCYKGSSYAKKAYYQVSKQVCDVYSNSVAPLVHHHGNQLLNPVSKAYQDNLAPHLKPVHQALTATKETCQPHIDRHLPTIQQFFRYLYTKIETFFYILLGKYRQGRLFAIIYLKQYPELSRNAHKIVDYSVGILLAPFVFLFSMFIIRRCLRFIGCVLSVLLYILCCGRRKCCNKKSLKKGTAENEAKKSPTINSSKNAGNRKVKKN